MKKRILGVTGIRSDYDLMSSLYKLLATTSDVDFRLLVGGAHMSRTYGRTVDLIRRDGIPILIAIESLIDGDTTVSRIKTGSIMLQSAIDAVAGWAPDLIIYAGDREEVLIGALLGTYLEVPTVHFYGGDHTQTGHVDNPIRHAVSKLATAHCVAIEEHKVRLMAMGENEKRIFVTGNISLDNFAATPTLARADLERRLGLNRPLDRYAIVIFHPDPSEKDHAAAYMENIMESLLERGISVCVGYPNTDPANKNIIDVIERYGSRPECFVYRNLERDEFISLYRGARFIIGNSSSGIMEAASVPIPAINVGLRQRGRLAGENVLFCDGDRDAIGAAIAQVESAEFRELVKLVKNPYGSGCSAELALNLLLASDFEALRLKTEDPLSLSASPSCH